MRNMLGKIKPLNYLLLAFPAAVLGSLLHANPIFNFVVACLGLIPLAGLIGESTEVLAFYTGPKIGGLLNATLGNAAELIITIVAIKAGLLDLVKASITGSIIGNLLLVLGFSVLLGGLKHGPQRFGRAHASTNATMLVLAVIALTVPSLFNHTLTGTVASGQHDRGDQPGRGGGDDRAVRAGPDLQPARRPPFGERPGA